MKCILCSSEIIFPLEFLKHSKREFLICPRCDLIFVPEKYHLKPDEEAARYRMHRNTLSNEGYVGMFLEKIALVQKYCPDVTSVVDYGCGPAPILAELLKRKDFPVMYMILISFQNFQQVLTTLLSQPRYLSISGTSGKSYT